MLTIGAASAIPIAAAFPRQIRVRDGRLEELEGRPA